MEPQTDVAVEIVERVELLRLLAVFQRRNHTEVNCLQFSLHLKE
jgi:hypothetical protein